MNEFYTYVYYTLADASVPTYVGKGKGARMKFHPSAKTHFGNHIRKQLRADIFPITVKYPQPTEQAALDREIELIALYGRKDLGTGSLYNKTDGGEGASGVLMPPPTPEYLAKLSIAGKRNVNAINALKAFERTPEYCAKLSVAGTGRIMSAESIAKTVATKKERGTASTGTHSSWATRRARYPNGLKRNGEIK
jgi:hypothetical protein